MARETAAARKARAARIVRQIARAHPDARCALHYRTPFQLLIATILSAQCTDERVNRVTAVLFRRFPTAAELAAAAPEEVESIVRPTGFYRQKARSVLAASAELVANFGGEVPATVEDLTSLRGVARKTANVVLGEAFGIPALAIDTHMKRIHQRLGLTRSDDPDQIERDLSELVPRSQWARHTQRIIHHGRECCQARSPRCETCPIRGDCPWPGARRAEAPGRRPAGGRRAARAR